MKIHVKSGEHNIRLWLPTNLFFNPLVARVAVRYGLRNAPESVRNISPEAIEALFAEFRRIKKKHGHWELVDMVRENGTEVVKILL